MKTTRASKDIGLLATALLFSAAAHAGASASGTPATQLPPRAIPAGYFKGEEAGVGGNRHEAKVYLSRGKLLFGIVLRKSLAEGADEYPASWDKASIFRVEELADGTQNWIHLEQTTAHSLSAPPSMEASYTARLTSTSSERATIRLTPTKFGIDRGCEETIEARHDDEYRLVSLPKEGVRLGDVPKVAGVLGRDFFNGRFELGGKAYEGDFRLEPLFPAVALLRARTPDAESAEGTSQEDEITAVVVSTFRDQAWPHADYYEAHVIRLEPGATGICHSPDTAVEQD